MSYLRYVNSYCHGYTVVDTVEDFLRGQGIHASVTNIQDDARGGRGIMGNIRIDHIEAHANLNIDLPKIINRHLKVTLGVESRFRISNISKALASRPSRHKRVHG